VSVWEVVGSRRDLVVSGEAVVAVDADLRVVSWNSAAEELTGVAADDALGQPCWLVLRGQSPRGAVLCHRDCSVTRYARRGYPVARQNMNIATTSGPRSVSVSTVVFRDRREPLLLHVLQDGEQDEVETPRPQEPPARLTARQHQVLGLLAEGVTARRIADRLGLAEATVRNHIRAVLSELGAHSQLEAVARARAQGLV
jgi:DNA-binding CsgD family transcriptional regulator